MLLSRVSQAEPSEEVLRAVKASTGGDSLSNPAASRGTKRLTVVSGDSGKRVPCLPGGLKIGRSTGPLGSTGSGAGNLAGLERYGTVGTSR